MGKFSEGVQSFSATTRSECFWYA